VQLPAVRHIERRVHRWRLGLREHEEVGLHLAEFATGLGPEVVGDAAGDVAAEAINFHRAKPPRHIGDHRAAHGWIVVVQFGDVGPVGLVALIVARIHDTAVGFVFVPVGMRGDPRMIVRRVIRHPVEDYPQAAAMRRSHEVVYVGGRPELGIDLAIVRDRVRTAERPFAVHDADRLEWHHPEDIDAERFEARQLFSYAGNRSLWRILPDVHLVDHRVACPRGVSGLLGGGEKWQSEAGEGNTPYAVHRNSGDGHLGRRRSERRVKRR
jgi:hypothetical protein